MLRVPLWQGHQTRLAKQKRRPEIAPCTTPGECVSVDQLESSTLGLVAQVKGQATTKRYNTVTVFVDHFTRFTFVYAQPSTDGTHTLLAKQAFETFAASVGVAIRHYHGDNGRFAENLFLTHARTLGQRVTHCGVNAHFQNGIAERRIRDLQDRARTMLVHAKHHWPDAIEPCMWPFAIRLANEAHNCAPFRNGLSPIALFSRSRVLPNLDHLHPFGCPTNVLGEKMQSDKKGPKWGERARCGIYLGLSPNHARSVSLVMSLSTGMVSPQYHLHADEFFETVTRQGPSNPVLSIPYKSEWQERLGFPRSNLDHPVITDRHADSEGAPAHLTTSEGVLSPTASEGDSNKENADAPNSDDDDDWHSVAASAATHNDSDADDDEETAEAPGTPPAR